MGRKGSKHPGGVSRAPEPISSNRRKWFLRILSLIVVTGVSAMGVAIAVNSRQPPVTVQAARLTPTQVKPARHAASLDDLLKMTPEQLAEVDLAEMNLVCATGLPGAENLNIDQCLTRLDDWALRVRYWTDQSMWDFRQHPQNFRNSEAKFRVLLLISVLQQDFGVHYNDRGLDTCDFSNSKNAFLHGMIDDPNGGTCASMPVMCVAVGRRLAYPMKLILAKTHVFARWEDPVTGERFNIEGTNAQFADHPDSYYRNWPYPITDAELKQGWYLKPLTPPEELAIFLHNRAFCLMDSGRFDEAKVVLTHSCRLAPQDPLGPSRLAGVTEAASGGPARPVRGMPMRPSAAGYPRPRDYHDPLDQIERLNDIRRASIEARMQPPQLPPSYTPFSPYRPNGPASPYQQGRSWASTE